MGFVVIIRSPDTPPREFRLVDGETSLGRDPANTIVLDGRGVSRRHAKFILDDGRLTLVDVGSTYGTRVNEVTTLRREISHGDQITVGMHNLQVQAITDPNPDRPAIEEIHSAEAYFVEEVTQAPGSDIFQRKTVDMSRSSIRFVMDGEADSNSALRVLPRHDSDLMKAVQRFGTSPSSGIPVVREDSSAAPGADADYEALLLMYRVSELLANAADLGGFLEQVADLVLEEVRADTVVVLMQGEGDELVPEVIRHRGSLTPGEIPISRGIVERVMLEKVSIMSNDVSQDNRIKSGQSVMLYKIRAVMVLPLLVQGELQGVMYIGRSGLQNFSTADGELLSALVSLIASGIQRAELKEKVLKEKEHRKALERFHPPEVVDRLFSRASGEPAIEEHQSTVLVCDLEEFSSLVTHVPPWQLASVLHEYYEMLYDRVFANGGSLVKLHDGWALALFGAPHSPDRDAAWALETAKELCEEFRSISVLWPNSQSMALRCALDTGDVVSGVVGSAERLEYAAIGLPISTASLLAAHLHGTGIILTDRTWSEIPRSHFTVDEVTGCGDVRAFRVRL